MKPSLIKDKYKSARGGHSRLLNIHCRQCESVVLTYQKDGPGNLLRLYLDRITSPANLVNLYTLNLNDLPVLRCQNCSKIIGTPYIYMKEKRKAYRLHGDSFFRRLASN